MDVNPAAKFLESNSQITCTYDLIRVVKACEDFLEELKAKNWHTSPQTISSDFEFRDVLLLHQLPPKAIGHSLSYYLLIA